MWLHVFLPPVVHKTVQVNTLTTYIVDEVSPIGIGIDFVESAALCQGICEGKVLGGVVTSAEKEVLASAGKVPHALLCIVVVHSRTVRRRPEGKESITSSIYVGMADESDGLEPVGSPVITRSPTVAGSSCPYSASNFSCLRALTIS